MATDVRATCLLSLSPVIWGFFGTGMMVERLKHERTSHSNSDLLKICVKMGGGSWVSTGLKTDWCHTIWAWCLPSGTRPGTRHPLLSAVQVWGRGGLQEVWMAFFQTCNRTYSDRLPVVDSPQCWGMVSCNWWCFSDLFTLKQNHWKRISTLAFQNNSSLPLWSPFPVCIWPVFTRLCPLLVGIFFGLTELSEFCSEPRFVVVIS